MSVPASRQKSDKWFVRVDGPKEFLETKCGELSRCIDVVSLLAAYHTGETKENPHCHFVIQVVCEVQKQSFAVRIKNLFGIDKKSNYSINVWDGNRCMGAVSYLFHETSACVIANRGFSDEDLANARAANDAVQAVVSVNAERASNKLVQKAMTHFAGFHATRRDILLYMLREIHDGNNYHPGEMCLKRYVEEVEIKRSSHEELEELAYRMEKNLWREY